MTYLELRNYYRTLVTCHSELCWLFEKEIAEPPVRNLIKTFREEMQRVEQELDKKDIWSEVHEQDDVPNPFEDLTLEELHFLSEHRHLLEKFKIRREKKS